MTTLLRGAEPAPEPPFVWSEHDRQAALTILGRATHPCEQVFALSDEEIVALDGTAHSQIVPTPWLDAQTFTKDALGGIALRGLIARGQVALGKVETPEGEETGQLKLTAVAEITGPLMLRRTSQRLVRVERQTPGTTAWAFAYVHEGERVLIEDVDPNGLHLFLIGDLDAAAAYLAGFANVFEIEGSSGGVPERFTEAEFAALSEPPAALRDSEAISTVVAFRHSDEHVEVRVVYAGPERLGVLDIASDEMVASAVSDADLAAGFRALLRG